MHVIRIVSISMGLTTVLVELATDLFQTKSHAMVHTDDKLV